MQPSDLDIWAALVGFLMPPVIAVVNRPTWQPWIRAVVAVAANLVAGGMTAYLTGYLHGVSIIHAVLVVLFAALGSYRVFWQPSKIVPKIEAATSPSVGGGRHELWDDDESERQLRRS